MNKTKHYSISVIWKWILLKLEHLQEIIQYFLRDFIYIGLSALDSVKARFFGDKTIKIKIFFFCISGERPFVCQICNKAFNQKNALNIHIKKHTGEKPHKCDYCELSFSQKGNLKTHIKRAHHMDMVHSMNLPKTLYVPPSAGGLDEEMNAKEEGSTAEEDQINLEQVAQELFPQWGVYRLLLTIVSEKGSVHVAFGLWV